MAHVHLITVGKLKDKNLEAIELDYLKRIKKPKLTIYEVKAKAQNKDLEAEEVLKKIQDLTKNENTFSVVLTEFGNEFDSPKFSSWLTDKIDHFQHIVFIIAGAEGPGEKLLSFCQAKLSLSKLTFPHRLARVLFIEQFYRALTIRDKHPYHN